MSNLAEMILRHIRRYSQRMKPHNLENTADLNIHQGSWGFLKYRACMNSPMFKNVPCMNATIQTTPKTLVTQDPTKRERGRKPKEKNPNQTTLLQKRFVATAAFFSRGGSITSRPYSGVLGSHDSSCPYKTNSRGG